MTKAEPGIGQASLPLFIPEEVQAPDVPEGFDLERRTSFSHLIRVIGDNMALPPDFTRVEDLERVDPASIERGLVFPERYAYERRLKNVYLGIGFSATQFLEIARSPSDLAGHVYTKAKKANEKRAPEERHDRDTAHATASRAAGHSLEERVLGLTVAQGQLASQRLDLLRLNKELRAPGRAHWSGRNLDALRRLSSNVIHSTIEIAATNLPWDNQTADDLQDALHYNLYGHAGHNNRRLGFWTRYVLMAGKHTRRQLEAVTQSLQRTTNELVQYQPYLDAAKDADE